MTEFCKDKLLECKANMEAALRSFNENAKQISAMGFNIQVQPDETTYVFKNTTTVEAYGNKYLDPSTIKTVEVTSAKTEESCTTGQCVTTAGTTDCATNGHAECTATGAN